MLSNKGDSRYNKKNKADNVVHAQKKTPNVSLTLSRMKTDSSNKAQLQFKTPAPTPNRIRKLHNCLPSTILSGSKKQASCLDRKAISLVELTPETPKTIWTPKKWQSKEHGDEDKIKNIFIENKTYIVYPSSSGELELAKKVCKMFLLHAWRKCRAQFAELQQKTQKLEHDVQNLNLQNVVLMNLLESEKLRVAVAMSDSSHLRERLENELKTVKILKEDLNQFVAEKSKWENIQVEMNSEITSLKKEVCKANKNILDLKEQCLYYEKSNAACRDRELELQNKLGVTETCLRDKVNNLQELRKRFAENQTQIKQLIAKNLELNTENENKQKNINECVSKIRKMDVELNNLKNIRKIQNENISNLTKDITVSSEKIQEQDQVIERLNKLADNLHEDVKHYKSEREEFEDNLKKVRNRVVFEAIKISAKLFFPMKLY